MTSDSRYTHHRYPLSVPGISSYFSSSRSSFLSYFSIILSLLSVRTSNHQPTIGYIRLFLQEESSRGVKLTTHLHLLPEVNNKQIYTSAPPAHPRRGQGQIYLQFYQPEILRFCSAAPCFHRTPVFAKTASIFALYSTHVKSKFPVYGIHNTSSHSTDN